MGCTLPLAQVRPDDVQLVGGKGLSLGLMTAAGLPVPPGFCIATDTYRRAVAIGAGDALVAESDRAEIVAAYARMGRPCVAVRSSATAEDGATASFAGQQETILGVEGDAALIAAIEKCWASLQSERAVAYRREQNVNETNAAMAVVVQRLVHAELAGVLFTRDPLDPLKDRMLVEASWGLGEAVVSGRVSPDRFHVARDTGAAIDQQIGVKRVMRTADGWHAIESEQQSRSCLDADHLRELAAIGRQIEEVFGGPRDVEWAWDGRQFWLLQARPITAGGAFEREQVRREEIAVLRDKSAPGGTVWARYNLAEVLPTPTPMTWSIVQRFMSGRGGYGLMYRDLGYDPDPSLDHAGFIDLICGRPYVNLSREPLLYFKDFPFRHDFAALKANPERAMYPTPTVDRSLMNAGRWLKLPLTAWRMLRSQVRANRLRWRCVARLRGEVFPEMVRRVEADRAADVSRLAAADLLSRLHAWCDFTLVTFSREALSPGVFAGAVIQQLDVQGIGRDVLADVHPSPAADLGRALQSLASGTISRDEFLQSFGHRGPNEMELAEPRWAERVDALIANGPSPSAPLPNCERREMPQNREIELARELLAAREEAKHYFMLGYSMIRRYLVAIDELYRLGGGIFFLSMDELPQLIAGERFDETIRDRRRRRRIALSLDVPPVLFSDDLDAIGRPIVPGDATELRGTPVSAGTFEGIAVVLDEPTLPEDAPAEFVLVCPSTDPAWVPVFLRAKALVMESGGVLSHGAIVAREFGLPAVAGLPDVQRRLCTGQRIRVDGTAGLIHVLRPATSPGNPAPPLQ